ncbi:MAG: histidine phosphatase family protein [Promethearchaeota archaeon]
MNYKSIWNQSDWTEEARSLLKGLDKFPEDSKIIFIIRHSHRKSIEQVNEKTSGIRLTKIGHEIAKIFASNLPLDRTIRLFYSPVQRCKETAIDIFEGFKYVSGQTSINGPINELYDFGIEANFFFEEINKYPTQFLYRWAAGLYPSEKVTPFKDYCQNALRIILAKNIKSSKKSIDIYVSHDLIILAYRLGWFGLSPEGKRPSFLGGFAFAITKGNILLLDVDKLLTVEIPYWWNVQNNMI